MTKKKGRSDTESFYEFIKLLKTLYIELSPKHTFMEEIPANTGL